MNRGRGLLEVKPSPSPFFQSASSEYGVNVTEKKNTDWKFQTTLAQSTYSNDGTFSFLYTRESDKIGGGIVAKPNATRAEMPSKVAFLRKRKEDLLASGRFELVTAEQQAKPKPDVEAILQTFKQGTKAEDPRYTTTGNEYGKKAPTVATFVAERMGRQQAFSNSFQNIKPVNSGLNCGLSKSQVHKQLDPQFA
jgi:Domain of unknown function (DUF4490)